MRKSLLASDGQSLHCRWDALAWWAQLQPQDRQPKLPRQSKVQHRPSRCGKNAEKLWSITAQTTGIKKRMVGWAKNNATQEMMLAQSVLAWTNTLLALAMLHLSASKVWSTSVVLYLYMSFCGQNEASGLQTHSMQSKWKIGTCGITIDGVETKVAPGTDDFSFSGRNITIGYLKVNSRRNESFDDDGWATLG
ncbi:unnamed protein product [Peronospora belbahrii]|uniref:Uncharacterized protein n=1 Tax=Peronospora belbahrii TaxID=622444 RepID=A0ABN8CKQ8_9STRA|nr:unnamed protein product [Peronospora belbahrii]